MNLLINYVDLTKPNMNQEVKITTSTFPAGENYLKISEDFVEILKNIKHSQAVTNFITVTPLDAKADTIIDLILFSNAVSELKVSVGLVLNTYYLPYSRQDRVCSSGESNSLKVFIDIISGYYTTITTLDVHNPNIPYPASWKLLSPDYKNDFISARTLDKLEIPVDKDNTIVVAPDLGVVNRSKNVIKELELLDDHLIIFNKVRDNGKIIHTRVQGFDTIYNTKSAFYLFDDICDGSAFYIFDDICDGGETFISVLGKLNVLYPNSKKYLVVTHGIFSKGLANLTAFDDIFVHDNPYNRARLELITQNEIQF